MHGSDSVYASVPVVLVDENFIDATSLDVVALPLSVRVIVMLSTGVHEFV